MKTQTREKIIDFVSKQDHVGAPTAAQFFYSIHQIDTSCQNSFFPSCDDGVHRMRGQIWRIRPKQIACGIFDAVAIVNGKKVIIDYKTSKRVYNDHRYQIAGYRGAYEEENGKIDGAIVLHFDKETGEFDMVELTDEDYAADYPVFLACYEIKKREKELTKLNGYVPE